MEASAGGPSAASAAAMMYGGGVHRSTDFAAGGAALAEPVRSSAFPFPPGYSEETEAERARRRQEELDGDEALAAQLAAQLRLTSPAEWGEPAELGDDGPSSRLPRVGDSRGPDVGDRPAGISQAAVPASGGGAPSTALDEPHYAVEYHALDSDGEDAFGSPSRNSGVANQAQVICSALTGLFRSVSGRWPILREADPTGAHEPLG
eukprot:TRINITY_DN23458_c0_g1_i1.p1 TRINITY_DN23458_c0_g1~~TRINITY_DN23458_c0_g1_i1.p1  ORF type:complete len:206 (+),score=39.13 TRINITY_DN23458_c0_g1_i1:107-724(+)